MTADHNCRARYKTPYIGTKRQWERRRVNEEAEATATNYSTSKPRSRSRTPSPSHSRSRSRTPGPRKQQQRRARSRKPGRTPTRDAKATDSVSFADVVKGKRAKNAEAGGKTHTKIEAQIHAKDELIQKLQSAAHSETDQQAMQETQEELIEDGEVDFDNRRHLLWIPARTGLSTPNEAAHRVVRGLTLRASPEDDEPQRGTADIWAWEDCMTREQVGPLVVVEAALRDDLSTKTLEGCSHHAALVQHASSQEKVANSSPTPSNKWLASPPELVKLLAHPLYNDQSSHDAKVQVAN
ncbi:hypothetical protein HPB51_022158 [Rhipicephalus microplus]|uniref:Uncharacterized protein n=1 Tax=Rhipicephalus microplus TaxID=6941 RepID=A0A9J6E3U8_RHIMP|nr:hypothetical protein HPB51_022158 [Rhipicephalus microplus]